MFEGVEDDDVMMIYALDFLRIHTLGWIMQTDSPLFFCFSHSRFSL